MVRNLPTMQEPEFDPQMGKFPWRRESLPTPVIPWTVEPGGLQSTGSQSDTTKQLTLLLSSGND